MCDTAVIMRPVICLNKKRIVYHYRPVALQVAGWWCRYTLELNCSRGRGTLSSLVKLIKQTNKKERKEQ